MLIKKEKQKIIDNKKREEINKKHRNRLQKYLKINEEILKYRIFQALRVYSVKQRVKNKYIKS